ncbi:MAG: PAS domain S-box protein [Magnetospirillum sp.]|nr:PAS domain S-box protein [Magnetospirillum sp.]
MAGNGLMRRWQAAWKAFRDSGKTPQPAIERPDALLEMVPAIIYAQTGLAPSGLTFVGGNVKDILGYTAAEVMAHPDFWVEHLHAEDRERCLATLRQLREVDQVEMEYRMRAKDGHWVWLHDECRAIRDDKGNRIEVVGSCIDVSRRYRFEQELARSEADLRAAQARLVDALESSGDGFSVFDAQDRLVAFNSRYLAIYPTIADIIRPGVSFEELLRTSAARGQYKGVDARQVESWVRDRLEKHRNPQDGAFEQLLDDGRWLEIVERPTAEGGRVAIRREITERKHFEATLKDELAFKQTLIDALPFPVFYKNTDLVYLGCNGAFAEALGKAPEDIVGKTLTETYSAEKAAEFSRRDLELLASGGVQRYETTFRWGDGSMRSIAIVKATFAGPDGQTAGLIGTIIDLTQQKQAEDELVRTARLATLGQIASEVAHELNQPLSILRMTAENAVEKLSRGDLPADGLERKLAVMVEQASRMADMIGHLRSFVRGGNEERQSFSPLEPIKAALNLMRQQFVLDDIAVCVDLPEQCPSLTGQQAQLEQVVIALLSNARDAVCAHRPPRSRNIWVELTASSQQLLLCIRDNGGGVRDDLWPRVFTPFFTTKRDGAGTGLGLSASLNIVAGMGGQLHGRNVGQGAEFRVVWPLGAAPVRATDSLAPPRQHRVLVVDDEPLAVECLHDYLQARGYEVVTAISPLDAVEMARSSLFDLVLTDQRMPGMDGNVLISRLRELQPGLAAIMMSGGTMPLPPASEGPVARLNKPLVLDELGQTVERMLADAWTPPSADDEPPPDQTSPGASSPAQRLWQMGELTAHLAHDFGQPLNIIRLNVENLLDGFDGDDRQRRGLGSTLEQCRRMQEMTQKLLAATRRPKTPGRRFDILGSLRRVLAEFQDHVRMQDIAFRWHAATRLPPVSGHPQRFEEAVRQVLRNSCQALASEALARHTQVPPWRAELTVSCQKSPQGGIDIVVADNGPGLPDEIRQAVENGTGRGLGLPIAMGVVAEMDGSLVIDKDGPGAIIRIHLPTARRRVHVVAPTEQRCPNTWEPVADPAQAEAALVVGRWPDILVSIEETWRQIPDRPLLAMAALDPDQARQAVSRGATMVLPLDTDHATLVSYMEECLDEVPLG